jgi:membrane-bound inhibitor of C-type lysozyme
MENISSKYPGVLYPRGPRSVIATLTSGTALMSTNNLKLCYVDGTNFKYDGTTKGAVTAGAKSMVDFNGYILIFPDKKYYNYLTDTFANIGTGSPADGEAPTTGQCPNMDKICVFNNRVWGIKNRTVYGSKYNDPLTWAQYTVPVSEDDSVYFKISIENGNLLGILPLENHIVFAGKFSLYEMYGNKPSNYIPRLVTGSKGTLDGKSMVEIGGVAYALCSDGIGVYGGSYPRQISLELDETYVSGKAGTDGRRYYISLYNGTSYNLYYYDTLLGWWYREDDLQVIDFTMMDGSLYALASDNKIYRFDYGTENFTWWAETDRFTCSYQGHKGVAKVKIETELEANASLKVYLKLDDGSYSLVDVISATGYRYTKTYLIPQYAFCYQVKIEGKGIAKVYSLTTEVIVAAD